jgi:uncharacterized protein YjcR
MAKRIDYTEMKRLRDAGMRAGDIAARLDCSVAAVHCAVGKFGWARRKPGQRRDVDVPALHRMWHSDMDTPNIALTLGVSLSTLNNLRQRHGLPKRPRHAAQRVVDPTPDEIARRAKECRERHFAELRAGVIQSTWQGGAA